VIFLNAVTAEEPVTVSREVGAAHLFFGLGGIRGEALEHGRGEGVFRLVIMIRGERVGGGGGPLALAVAVQQGAEAAFPVVDLAGLIVAVSQIPPCHFGVRMIGKRGEVFGKNLRGALEVIDAVLLGGARLGGVVEVFAALEEVVGGVRTQRGIDGLGPGNLGDCRAGDEDEKCERAFQDAGSVVRFGAFAK
jgi:hypothetical protein